jgi:NAD(P)-dependent dehydrogenase (short-subunit alcohol dehydrogenase family)
MWSLASLPDASGKTILITGANSGIGWEAARMCAEKGAHVVLACRSPERAEDALSRLRARVPGANVALARLDLASLASIRTCAAELRDRFERIDVLVNNAGIMAIPRTLTEDGFEMQLGTNHLGHFALSGLVHDRVSRVVNVSSGVHWGGSIDFDDPMGERRYQKWAAYAQSKLANLLFTFEANRRHPAVVSVACHPGYASTNLQGVGPKMEKSTVGAAFFAVGNGLLAQPAYMGAWPTVHAALAEVRPGELYGPFFFGFGWPRADFCSPAARDAATAGRLWDWSVERTGVSW